MPRKYLLENVDSSEIVTIEAETPFDLQDYDLPGGDYQIYSVSDPAPSLIRLPARLPFNLSLPVMPTAYVGASWQPEIEAVWENSPEITVQAVVDGNAMPAGPYTPIEDDEGQDIFWRETAINADGEQVMAETLPQVVQPRLLLIRTIDSDQATIDTNFYTTDMA